MTPNAIKTEARPEWDTHEVRLAQRWGLFVVGGVIYRSVLFRPST